jgi:hypothetical protein
MSDVLTHSTIIQRSKHTVMMIKCIHISRASTLQTTISPAEEIQILYTLYFTVLHLNLLVSHLPRGLRPMAYGLRCTGDPAGAKAGILTVFFLDKAIAALSSCSLIIFSYEFSLEFFFSGESKTAFALFTLLDSKSLVTFLRHTKRRGTYQSIGQDHGRW